MNQNRNYEKEVIFLSQEISHIISEKAMLQAMLDDALAKIEELQKQESTEL